VGHLWRATSAEVAGRIVARPSSRPRWATRRPRRQLCWCWAWASPVSASRRWSAAG